MKIFLCFILIISMSGYSSLSASQPKTPHTPPATKDASLPLDQIEINDIQTLEELQALADKGNSDAAARVGDAFLFGPDNIRHTGYALYYLKRASARGHLEATEILAGMYLNGNGVDKNAPMAARLYETCSVRGYGPCQFNLGIMYKNGDDNFPKDPEKAYYWLYKASLNEKTLDAVVYDAAHYRNEIGAELTQEQRMRVFDKIYPRHPGIRS